MAGIPIFPAAQILKMAGVPVFPGSQVIKMADVPVSPGSQVIKIVGVFSISRFPGHQNGCFFVCISRLPGHQHGHFLVFPGFQVPKMNDFSKQTQQI